MNNDKTLPRPLLILVRGLPGSGKSYLAKGLQQVLSSDQVIMLDPDTVDTTSEAYQNHAKQATAEGVDPALHLYRFSRAQAYQGIADGKIIIWNQPFNNLEIFHKMMARLETQATEHNTSLHTLIVEVETNPKTAEARVVARKQAGGHGPSHDVFARFAREYISFAGEGYSTVTLSGTDPIETTTGQVLAAAQQLAD